MRFKYRLAVVEGFAHFDILRTLPGKDKGDFCSLQFGNIGKHIGAGVLLGHYGEFVDKLLFVFKGDGAAILMVIAPYGCGINDVVYINILIIF